MSEDPMKVAQEAIEQRPFSVIDFAKKRTYPTDDITVYTDVAAAYELRRLNTEAADVTGLEDGDEERLAAIEERIREVQQRIRDGALVFHMRGQSMGAYRNHQVESAARHKILDVKDLTDEASRWANFKLLAESIIRVTAADGSVDEHHWSVEDVQALYDELATEEFDKIGVAALNLTFAAAYFEGAVDADF